MAAGGGCPRAGRGSPAEGWRRGGGGRGELDLAAPAVPRYRPEEAAGRRCPWHRPRQAGDVVSDIMSNDVPAGAWAGANGGHPSCLPLTAALRKESSYPLGRAGGERGPWCLPVLIPAHQHRPTNAKIPPSRWQQGETGGGWQGAAGRAPCEASTDGRRAGARCSRLLCYPRRPGRRSWSRRAADSPEKPQPVQDILLFERGCRRWIENKRINLKSNGIIFSKLIIYFPALWMPLPAVKAKKLNFHSAL